MSDDESDESESEQIRNLVSFTAHIADNAPDDFIVVANSFNPGDFHASTYDFAELCDEFLVDTYKVIYYKWIEESQSSGEPKLMIDSFTENKTRLLETILDLKREVSRLH